jgi:hypothetical protein
MTFGRLSLKRTDLSLLHIPRPEGRVAEELVPIFLRESYFFSNAKAPALKDVQSK